MYGKIVPKVMFMGRSKVDNGTGYGMAKGSSLVEVEAGVCPSCDLWYAELKKSGYCKHCNVKSRVTFLTKS